MTTIDSRRYTIIDIYALRSLGVSDAPTDRVDYYLAYLRKCRELAQQFKVPLRTADHALWQWGYERRRSSVDLNDAETKGTDKMNLNSQLRWLSGLLLSRLHFRPSRPLCCGNLPASGG